MTATSTYGNSVKFYERIYELHGQLKHQEEEQFNLQAELHRLLPQYRSPRSEVADQADMGKVTSGVPINGIGFATGPGAGPEPSVDSISQDEKRRVRNDIILRKIKDLESTAALFAARSEKLRILRSEYETIVNRYMEKKSAHPRLHMSLLSNSTPSLLTLPGGLSPDKVTVGVNTEITGPVNPVLPETDEMRLLKMSPYAHASRGNGSAFTGGDAMSPSYSHFIPPTFPSHLKSFEAKESSSAPPEETSASEKYAAIIKASNQLLENQQISGATKSTSFPPPLDDGKLRHNVYFDLSTTSESEMTSRNVEKPKRSVPISFSFDDTTTQSDTVSLSTHVPTKLSAKLGMPGISRHLSMDFSSDLSESLLSRVKEKIPSNTDQLTPLKENGQADKFAHEEEEDEQDNDNDADPPSESMGTSVGDSVMDSVQNKTENIPPEVDSSAENLDKLLNASTTPGSFSEKEEVASENEVFKSSTSRRASTLELINNGTSSFPTLYNHTAQGSEQTERMQRHESPIHEAEDFTVGQRSSGVDPTKVMRRFSKIEDEFRVGDESQGPLSGTVNLSSFESVQALRQVSEASPPEDATLPSKPTSAQSQAPSSAEDPKLIPNVSFDKTSKTPSGSAAGRRMKIKTDYDTDSDASEPIKIKKAEAVEEKNADEGIQADDDDFDDFFDI